MHCNGGRISLYYGDPVENAAEAACLRRLKQDLAARGIDAVLLANLALGPKRRQVDLIVATDATAVVLEIKGYVHAVRGGVNGPWTLELGDGQTKRLGSTNPYQQALANRYAVTDGIEALLGIGSGKTKNSVAGMLCLFPAPIADTLIPASDFKLTIGGYADLLRLVATARPNALPLEDWHRFAQLLGLSDGSAAPPTDAETTVDQYLAAYRDLAGATAGPYVDPQFEGLDTTAALAERIAAGTQVQIVGPSGSGKTELLKALAQSAVHAGCLPVVLRAGHFERQLAPLLEAAVARFSTVRPTALFKAAASAGTEIILYVDALNECPIGRRADLIGALQAARINYRARLVLTTQDPVSLPTILSGEKIRLLQPDNVQSQRLVTAHLGRALIADEQSAVEVVATAHDAAVLAAVLETPGNTDGRFALYHSFVQKRLDAQPGTQVGPSLAALASAMRTSFVSSLPTPVAERILAGTQAAVIETVRASGLIRIDGNRLSFRHDLIADFFAAEDILHNASTLADLNAIARRPINAELREFLLGGCATNAEIDALIGQAPDPRLLRAALSGRAGGKAKRYVIGRLRDLIGQLKRQFTLVRLSLPEGVTRAQELHSLIPSFADQSAEQPVDNAYLQLLPAALGEGLIADLLHLFGAVDQRLAAEAERLRSDHPQLRVAWRAAASGSIYGMHFHSEGRELQELLSALQNTWFGEAQGARDLGLRHLLDGVTKLSPGQIFFLVAALRSARNERLPSRFPELLRHIWALQIYHLRLSICDIIHFRGSELLPSQREEVREALNGWLLSNHNIFLKSSIIDALEGVEGIEPTLTVEAAVQEYEAMLALPETPETRGLAVSAVTRTYDHPFRDIYWEAFYEVLAPETRQALLLRGLRETPDDPWSIHDILQALRSNPTAAAAPELQRLGQIPIVEGYSPQYSIRVYAEAIAILAKLAIPLAPPEAAPEDLIRRAWFRAAPLIHALNTGASATPKPMETEVAELLACGAAPAFDVIQRLTREAQFLGQAVNVRFENAWAELVLNLCRTVLSPGFIPASLFERCYFNRTLADDHIDIALGLMAKVGRPSDVALVGTWLNHLNHGERALTTARTLERGSD